MMHQGHAMEPEHTHYGSSPEAALTSPDKISEMHTGHEQHASYEASTRTLGIKWRMRTIPGMSKCSGSDFGSP